MKKFIAPNMKEGIAQMRKELGEDAVILSTRNVKVDGSDDIIEIIAALDEPFTANERLSNAMEDAARLSR